MIVEIQIAEIKIVKIKNDEIEMKWKTGNPGTSLKIYYFLLFVERAI
jgi:hypothetical protein